MLEHLHIQNYAIIDEIMIDFSRNLNIITGETGAGKSILMGALGLVLGERADSSALWQKEKKCFVEAVFKSKNKHVQDFLKLHDLDSLEEINIRREISSNGKSRAFINDTPVNLNQLRSFASLLVDLHQQFDTLELGDESFQGEVIDALANNATSLEAYRSAFNYYQKAKKELDGWKHQQSGTNKELDYHKFLFEELDEAAFKENEIEELESQIKLLANSEEIKAAVSGMLESLSSSDSPLIPQVKSITVQLQNFSAFHKNIPSLVERLHSTQVELQDIADELERVNDSINFDPSKFDEANERMSLGYRLLKKHSLQSTAELLELKAELFEKLDHVMNLDERIAKGEKELVRLKSDALSLANILTANREKQTFPFEQKVNNLLKQVGMPNAAIKVQLEAVEITANGQERISFLFDANKTNRFEPLNKVASGGELSRLMLSIKSLVARSVKLPVLIFDEIDTGISGEAAKQVGLIMKELSAQHQVIAITHQPQIAARADAHYFVYKENKGKTVSTSIRLLEKDERVTAIARMLSGEKPTLAALENAREMVGN